MTVVVEAVLSVSEALQYLASVGLSALAEVFAAVVEVRAAVASAFAVGKLGSSVLVPA